MLGGVVYHNAFFHIAVIAATAVVWDICLSLAVELPVYCESWCETTMSSGLACPTTQDDYIDNGRLIPADLRSSWSAKASLRMYKLSC